MSFPSNPVSPPWRGDDGGITTPVEPIPPPGTPNEDMLRANASDYLVRKDNHTPSSSAPFFPSFFGTAGY